MFEKFLKILVVVFFLGIPFSSQAAENVYYPPFELHGIVSEIFGDSVEVFIPKIGKTVLVTVPPKTIIVDDSKVDRELSELKENDLVAITGIIYEENFQSQRISFFPVTP